MPPHSPTSPKSARTPLPAKTIFDGTKLSVDPHRPKTTTYGRNCYFRVFLSVRNLRLSHRPERSSRLQARRVRALRTTHPLDGTSAKRLRWLRAARTPCN